MNHLERFKATLYLVTSGAVIGLAILMGQVLMQVKTSIAELQNRLDQTAQNTNAVLIQAGLTADEVRRAATEQRTYWAKTSQETTATVSAIRDIVQHTDEQLNGQLLPDTATVIAKASGNLDRVAESADGALSQLNIAAAAVAEQVSDPAINQTVQSLQKSSVNVALATESLAGAAEDVRKKVHQATRPASLAVRVGTTLLGLSAKVGQILAGVR